MNKGQDFAGSSTDLSLILSPRTIRSQCERIYRRALDGKTQFAVHPNKLEATAAIVAGVTKEKYPSLQIPFHSRWRHFEHGVRCLSEVLEEKLRPLSREDRARAKLDLAIVSVLLDAGAGMAWKYRESPEAPAVGRSEGLAIASVHMFLAGLFSSDPKQPLRADSKGLLAVTEAALARGFQASAHNPLVGLEGRLHLLHALGRVVQENAPYFPGDLPRPGNLYDFLAADAQKGLVRAKQILSSVQCGLGPIWPNRISMNGFNLGDVWVYPPFGPGLPGLVPLHKLSQWLSYSLIEPLEEAGLQVTKLDDLTPLAEYRNGGLVLDSGLISLRDPAAATMAHHPGSELIVEWRALTITLIEQLAEKVRASLHLEAKDFPLVKLLEGGTWWAGRKLAQERRADGGPPLAIESDGTVF